MAKRYTEYEKQSRAEEALRSAVSQHLRPQTRTTKQFEDAVKLAAS